MWCFHKGFRTYQYETQEMRKKHEPMVEAVHFSGPGASQTGRGVLYCYEEFTFRAMEKTLPGLQNRLFCLSTQAVQR